MSTVANLCFAGGWFPQCGTAAEDALQKFYFPKLGIESNIPEQTAFRRAFLAGHKLSEKDAAR